MIVKGRIVNVHQFPEQVTTTTERSFLSELRKKTETRRPCLVFDCSKLRRMDIAAINLLLSCLEEVMKRNGDVRLASLRRGAETALEVTGIGRLFEVYSTIAEAVQSFQTHAASLAPLTSSTEYLDQDRYAA
jgi:anti-anti-sigma factor